MTLTDHQKDQILELALKDVWRHRRKYLRRIFLACEDDGYGIAGYHHVLEEAAKVAKRAADAIAILEA